MAEYVALDVSMKSTSLHVVDEQGRCLWRGTCATDLHALTTAIRKHAPSVERVGLETGQLSTWLCHGLAEAGLPVVCMDARQAKAALSCRINKTDANDAEGLAQLLRTGFFRPVRVKAKGTMLVRMLLGARRQLVRVELDRLLTDGVTDEELEIAIGSLAGSFELGLEDTGSRMARNAGLLCTRGEITPIGEQVAKWQAVGQADVRRVVERVFAAEPIVVTVGPQR